MNFVQGLSATLLLVLSLGMGNAVVAADTPQPFAAPTAAQNTQQQMDGRKGQPLNNAQTWKDVRSGEVHQTQVRGVETGVLIQPQGETWKEIRNGPVSLYGGLLLVFTVLAITAFYKWRGPIRLHDDPTGRKMARFSSLDRMVHWAAAISFMILAVSGLILLFGKYVVLPVLGYTVFSWLAMLSKNLHNFVGPVFIVATIIMFVTYVKDNIWANCDAEWIARAGGIFSGEHVPSWRFNFGEKTWFWIGVTFLGVIMGATGLILDFPNFDQGRELMQQASIIHIIGAVIYICLSLGHIYMGTLGVDGAYESMRSGQVDETWAKEHHALWYKEQTGRSGKPATAVPPPAAAGKPAAH